MILARILPFFGTHTHSTLFRYLPGQFFDTRTDSTFSRYSPGFYHFSVLTQIRPFSGNRGDNFSILVRIIPFPGTRPDSTIFLYSHRFDPFPVIAGTVFRYSYGFYLFPVLARILPFFCTHTDSTFSGNRGKSFSILVPILAFPDTRPDSTIFQYSYIIDHFPVLVKTVFRYSHGL